MNHQKATGKLPSACTTIVVGARQTADGSRVFARSEDFDAFQCKNWLTFKPTAHGPREFVAKDSAFRCPLPAEALGYMALPDYQLHGEWGSAGFNTAGVGESSTETIFSSPQALAADPYVADGLAENCTFNIVLPYVRTAREGVERLGSLITQYGSAEGFGIGFIDGKETWYLENAGGHRWLACRMPDDKYFVTGNQSRFRHYDPNDHENFLASPDLIEWAAANGLYDPAQGAFDFHEAYAKDDLADTTYNYPRVWGLQRLFSPHLENDVARNTFPVFAEAESKISIADLRRAFRFHYDGSDHDPYLHSNGKEPWRPVSIFRTCQTHLLQVRPWLPMEIGRLNLVADGMADLGVFLPLYQGVESYPKEYTQGGDHCSDDSAYWKFRRVMTLAMTNYNDLAPIVKSRYAQLEAENDQRQQEMETRYVALHDAGRRMEAHDLLQRFSDAVLTKAMRVADDLANDLITRMCGNIQREYLFHGA